MRAPVTKTILAAAAAVSLVDAHIGVWTDGMYCPDKAHVPPKRDSAGFANVIDPLYQLERDEWWFQRVRGCDVAMPRGVLLVPANGEFTANVSDSRQNAQRGKFAAGRDAESEFQRGSDGAGCIVEPNLHSKSLATASGTAFAIAYVSTIAEVTPENLVVFSVAPNTPYERLARYRVPDLAACPPDGCICAWGWIPNICGQINMYMSGHKCQVTNVTPSGRRPGKAQPPGPGVQGPKQLIYTFQKSGNNYPERMPDTQVPTYSKAMGYMIGAQTDIFSDVDSDATTGPSETTSSPPVTPGSGSVKPAASPPTTSQPTPTPVLSPTLPTSKCNVRS